MMGMGGAGGPGDTAFALEDPDGDTGFDPGISRDPTIEGYGQSPPVINTGRAVEKGLRQELHRDWKQLSWWRTAVNNDPRVFSGFFKTFLEENSLAKFNQMASTANPPIITAPLTINTVKKALAEIRRIKKEFPNDEVKRVNEVYDKVYKNHDFAGVKEFVQISLDAQYGRRIGSWHKYMNQRRGANWFSRKPSKKVDPTYGTSKDFFDNLGGVSIDEAERALSRVEFLDGLALNQTDKDHSEVIYTNADGKKQELVTHSVSEVMVGKIKEYSSHFDLGKDAYTNNGEYTDKAICALALTVASHSQVARKDCSNQVEVLGLKTLTETMRLVEELACRHHKHVAMSATKIKQIDDAINKPANNYSDEQKARWEFLKLAMKVYSVKNSNALFMPGVNALVAKIQPLPAAAGDLLFEKDKNGDVKNNPYNRELISQQLAKVLGNNVYPDPTATARLRARST